MRCKCGETPVVFGIYARDRAGYHTPHGCGPHLLYEGATCRGAAGRWEAWCREATTEFNTLTGQPFYAVRDGHDTMGPDGCALCDEEMADCVAEGHARELTFTEAES